MEIVQILIKSTTCN